MTFEFLFIVQQRYMAYWLTAHIYYNAIPTHQIGERKKKKIRSATTTKTTDPENILYFVFSSTTF